MSQGGTPLVLFDLGAAPQPGDLHQVSDIKLNIGFTALTIFGDGIEPEFDLSFSSQAADCFWRTKFRQV